MTLKSSVLSDRQKAVIETIRMRLNEKQSLEYLKEVGFDIGPATYYREKRKVESTKLKRLYHIGKIGFQDQHLERIDIYEMGFKMMWKNVLREQDPYKQNVMIKDILLLQPYLSAYYETTKLVVIGDKQQQQSEYQEFLDKQLQQQSKKETTEFKQQQNEEGEDSINDGHEEEKYNNNNNINAKF